MIKRLNVIVLMLGLFLLQTGIDVETAHAIGSVLTVTGYGDFSDLNPGDGVCDTLSALAGDQCSLRAAIEELNAQGPDPSGDPHRINFNIVIGTGPFIITPATPLPEITVPVQIRGQSQPGATCPTDNSPANLLIVLDGSSAGADATGLTLGDDSDGSTIRGLVIGNFTNFGIHIKSDDNKVRCNHIGLGADGVTPMGNEVTGVHIWGWSNKIGGGLNPGQRNVISDNGMNGIRLSSAEANLIKGNYIGTTADGMSPLGNFAGIYLDSDNNIIGTSSSVYRNVISGNTSYGIRVNSGSDNLIQGNYIGVAQDGTSPVPNGVDGIQLFGAAENNFIGGTVASEGNIIAYNGDNGILVITGITGTPIQNGIRQNAIYENAGLGIELGEYDGPDSNDIGDVDSGENERQNYPMLTASAISGTIDVVLESEANLLYSVDIYRNDSCDGSGFGEGQEYLTTQLVMSDAYGLAAFSSTLTGTVPGDNITATVTNPFGSTSEFSACIVIN